MLQEIERTRNKDKNGNWTVSQSSAIEMPSTSNKADNTDKEHFINLEKKIDEITKGLDRVWSKKLKKGLSSENAEIICNYIISMRTEINPADYYRRDSIKMPYLLSRYLNNKPHVERAQARTRMKVRNHVTLG